MRKSIEESTILRELIKQRKSRVSDVRKVNTGCIPFLGLFWPFFMGFHIYL